MAQPTEMNRPLPSLKVTPATCKELMASASAEVTSTNRLKTAKKRSNIRYPSCISFVEALPVVETSHRTGESTLAGPLLKGPFCYGLLLGITLRARLRLQQGRMQSVILALAEPHQRAILTRHWPRPICFAFRFRR